MCECEYVLKLNSTRPAESHSQNEPLCKSQLYTDRKATQIQIKSFTWTNHHPHSCTVQCVATETITY